MRKNAIFGCFPQMNCLWWKNKRGAPHFLFHISDCNILNIILTKIGRFLSSEFCVRATFSQKVPRKGRFGGNYPLIYPRGVHMWVEKLSLINFDIYTLNIQSFTKIYTVYIYPSSVIYTPLGVGIDLKGTDCNVNLWGGN